MATKETLRNRAASLPEPVICFGGGSVPEWKVIATKKHLNCEGESCSLLADKCSPHVFLTCLKLAHVS